MNRHAQYTVDAVLDRQKTAWLDGSRPCIEDLMRDSSLPPESDVLLDLIYNEIVVREELGENPSLDEYASRYPHLDEDLKLHFEVHRAVQENLLTDTCRVSDGESLADIDDVALEIGPTLTDYEIVGELGRGGMGVVYKARHRRLKRFVALKMFQPGRRPSPRELERFRSEAEAIARLQHVNIVQVFEVGQEHGTPYLALELAENGTLQKKLQDLPYTPHAAAELIETLARAIQHAHEHHIIHRDLKPANVLFAADGAPKITDFGLAKLLEVDADSPRDATRSGEPIGTPRYMSPEQAEGRLDRIGPTTDVYALGTLLYECLTGQVPFVSASVVETVDKIRHDEPVPPRRLQPSIPRDLETICLNCLYKHPTRRYASAQVLAEDLRRFLQGEPIVARRTPVWERSWMWCRRRPAFATLIAASFLLIFGGVIVLGVLQHRERQRIATLRIEIAALMQEGQRALTRGEGLEAKERFQAALAKVQAEPALRDHELGVRGWLDHSHRESEQQRMKNRRQPPLFDQRRDDAFVQCLFASQDRPASIRDARQAIASALEFTPADDPAWHVEREALILLDADLTLRTASAAEALAIVDTEKVLSTRLGHLRRANLLDRLDRKFEAAQERAQAAQLAPKIALEALFRGYDHWRQKKWDVAIRDFDDALVSEPDHFLARYFQAACFLQLEKATEAKVALTACIGQRSHFVWNHLLRGQAYVQLGDLIKAAQDLHAAANMQPVELTQTYLDEALKALGKSIDALPPERKESLWGEKIITDKGIQLLREVPILRNLKKD